MRLVRALVVLVVVGSVLAPSSGVGSGDVAAAQTARELCDVGSVAQFTDVGSGDYAAEYILCMRALGLSVGRADGGYGPDSELTRGQMASFLVRLWRDVLGRGCPGDVVAPFVDVAGDAHETNIGCLYGLGITMGTTASTYGPGEKLKASQISRFLLRVYEKTGGRCDPAGGELERALGCLLGLGVIPSVAEGGGDGSVSRAQMAVYVIGLWHNISGRGVTPRPPSKPTGSARSDGIVTVVDLERLLAAVATLDPEADCPPTVTPGSLDDVAEVVRISGGCFNIDYVPLGGRTIEQVREDLAADPEVHAVDVPVTDIYLSGFPYDGEEQWHLERIEADKLWGERDSLIGGWPDDAEVVVAVIDDGVDGSHRDLDGNLVTSGDACHRDPNGDHGTHVAGIIAAERNGKDVVGVAPEVKILPIKIHFSADVTEDTAGNKIPKDPTCYGLVGTSAAAIRMAVDEDVDVINMSYGSSSPSATEATALLIAQEQGVVLIAAAGNCGNETSLTRCKDSAGVLVHNLVQYPAAYTKAVDAKGKLHRIEVIAVANTTRDDTRAASSTANEHVDIAAPGSTIRSTVPEHSCYLLLRCTTADKSGTSMAAPIVSAVVAHMKARHPAASYQAITETLLDTAVHPEPSQHRQGRDERTDEYGHGIVNPIAALEKLDGIVPSSATLAMAGSTVCAVRTGDTLDCWGNNHVGQANPPEGLYRAASLGVGFGCGIRTDGTITCWGQPVACWGHSLDCEQRWDYEPESPPSGMVQAVATGFSHACAIRIGGAIECWGRDDWGQTSPPKGTYRAITASGVSSCAVRTGGTIVCWGRHAGVLGDAPEGTYMDMIIAGNPVGCGLRDNGTIVCWGSARGRREILTPPEGAYKSIVTTYDQACALRIDGAVACWGLNSNGLLDVPSGTYSAIAGASFAPIACAKTPDDIIVCWGSTDLLSWFDDFPPKGEYTVVANSLTHTCGIRTDGIITCLGNDRYDSNRRLQPPEGTYKAVNINPTSEAACAIRTDGTIVCWGHPSAESLFQPPEGTYNSIAVSRLLACAIRTDGTIVCWGKQASESWFQPPQAGTYKAVDVRGSSACAIRTDEAVVCWGYQPDIPNVPPGTHKAITTKRETCAIRTDGTIACRGSHSFVDGLLQPPRGTYNRISAGRYHACAIRTDGTIACWGHHRGGLTDPPEGTYTQINASESHTCAIRSDNSVACWGEWVPTPEGVRYH